MNQNDDELMVEIPLKRVQELRDQAAAVEDDPRFAALELILRGEQPPAVNVKIQIGHTALSPALLATEFVVKDPDGNRLFKEWLHRNDFFPQAVEGIELPPDALERDLKLSINAILIIEETAQFVQDITKQFEEQEAQEGTESGESELGQPDVRGPRG